MTNLVCNQSCDQTDTKFQNKCFETWFLGNPKIFKNNPASNFLVDCIKHYNVKNEEYYLIGDAQTVIEGPIQREQIFAIIIKVKRKGKWIVPEDFQWKFFAHIWPNIIPLRRTIIKTYRFFKR